MQDQQQSNSEFYYREKGMQEAYLSLNTALSHEKIFQIFQTLHSRDEIESTGIGLTLVKKILDVYGGKIWIESVPDQGSTFLFTFLK